MIGLVVVAHAGLARELLNAAEMIVGPIPLAEHLSPFSEHSQYDTWYPFWTRTGALTNAAIIAPPSRAKSEMRNARRLKGCSLF